MTKNRKYTYADLTIQSDIALPELHLAKNNAAHQIKISLYKGLQPLQTEICIVKKSDFNNAFGQNWVSHYVAGSVEILRFHDLAEFHIDFETQRISCLPYVSTAESLIRHLLIDQVLPIYMHLTKCIVLHGSSVASTNNKAIAFIGPSGAGKSTLAAMFASQGHTIITDDCLILQPIGKTFRLRPTYQGLRLWPDSMMKYCLETENQTELIPNSSKKRVNYQHKPTLDGYTLSTIFLLERTTDSSPKNLHFEPITGMLKFHCIMQQLFSLIPDKADAIEQFRELSALLNSTKVIKLVYPDSLESLPLCYQEICSFPD
jgi:hypothetical protein